MARAFQLPDLGSGLQEAEIVRWHANVGERVARESVLCEVETEKSVIEIPVPFSGVLTQQAAMPGGRVKVGDVLAVIEEADIGPAMASEVSQNGKSPPILAVLKSASCEPVMPEQSSAVTAVRQRAMPGTRKLAMQKGVDVAALKGTGKDGRVTRQDVLCHADSSNAVVAAPRGSRFERFSMIRQTIADHMSRSWREIPHVFTQVEVDATRFVDVRNLLSDELGCKVPMEALLIAAALPALKLNPAFNATVHEDGVELHHRYDIGTAVDAPGGLLVPVLRNADTMPLTELIHELLALQEQASQRKLQPAQLKGATFTVNNIGALGRGMGTSIIPWGTTAILSMGRVAPRAMLVEGQVRNVPIVELALAFDHRAIDGGAAARFMKTLIRRVEQPAIGLLASDEAGSSQT